MAQITIDGTAHEVPQYKLREIKAAAPYIDRVLAERRALSARAGESAQETTERLVESEDDLLTRMTGRLTDTISVIAVGILKGRREFPYTSARISAMAEEIEADLSMDEINGLAEVFDTILREAGMIKKAALSPMMAGQAPESSASQSASTESSQS